MHIKFNSTFKQLLEKHNLPRDLKFQIDLPADIKKLLSSEIVMNDYGLGLASVWIPGLPDDRQESFREDFENHFHIDQYADISTVKQTLELGVKTLIELAKRFEEENITNVQLTYSLLTPEMGKELAATINIDDEPLISDRLSFHTKRQGQIVLNNEMFNDNYHAILTIDL